MQLINNWLNGSRNFIVGKSLYATLGKDDKLKQLFAQGATDYNKKRLVEELEKLNQQPIIIVAKKEPKEAASIAQIRKGFDEVSNSLYNEWNKHFAEMKLWQHKLDAFGTDNSKPTRDACFEICKKIKELEKLMMRGIETFDYYEEHKRLPNVINKKFSIPTNAVELAKFINAAARQIRRYRHSQESQHQQVFLDNKLKYKLATGNDYEFKN